MAQAVQRLMLNLPNAFTSEAKLAPDFFERIGPAILEPKAQLQDTCLTR